MMHPHTQLAFISDAVGFGVVATAFIPRGTIVWTLDALDRVIRDEHRRALPEPFQPVVDRYAYRDADGAWVLCWDHARYVNHSCEPTMLAPGLGFEIALRDIHPGEQLTDDYASLNIEDEMPCACGTPSCRGAVRATDFEALVDRWEPIVREAWADAAAVEQPLWEVLSLSDRERAERAFADPSTLPPLLSMRYPQPVARAG